MTPHESEAAYLWLRLDVLCVTERRNQGILHTALMSVIGAPETGVRKAFTVDIGSGKEKVFRKNSRRRLDGQGFWGVQLVVRG